MARPQVSITRIETFSAAHRLHSKQLSDEENRKIYGKCNNPNGHGHNYKVEVTVKGAPDPVTGMVINLEDLKAAITTVLSELDHKNLDEDVPEFRNTVSTTENLTLHIWNRLKQQLEEPDLLYEIVVHETDKNIFRYRLND